MSKERLDAVYAEHHTHYSRYGFVYAGEERGKLFTAWVGIGKRVLDLGCRDGSLTHYYAAGNTVTGVDIDQRALSLAEERLGISTIWLDLNREVLPLDDSTFDVVVAGEILEHLRDPTFVVGEVYRVLRPGGVFIGSVPNSFHWRARLAFLRGQDEEDETHIHRFSGRKSRALLGGFSQTELRPLGGIGGRRLPRLPSRLSKPILQYWPDLFAVDWAFRAVK